MLHMRTIGARAGVSPGTVYLYFAGKEGVLAALLLEDLEHAIETLDNSSGGLQEVLTSIVPDLIRLWRVGSSDVVRQFGVRAEEPPTEPDPLPQEKTVAVGVAAIERALIRAPKGPVRRKAH